MKLTVCIGSSCHLKGARSVIEQLQQLVKEKSVEEQVELCGTFCLGNCQSGVCVQIDEQIFSVCPKTTLHFFETEVLARVQV